MPSRFLFTKSEGIRERSFSYVFDGNKKREACKASFSRKSDKPTNCAFAPNVRDVFGVVNPVTAWVLYHAERKMSTPEQRSPRKTARGGGECSKAFASDEAHSQAEGERKRAPCVATAKQRTRRTPTAAAPPPHPRAGAETAYTRDSACRLSEPAPEGSDRA